MDFLTDPAFGFFVFGACLRDVSAVVGYELATRRSYIQYRYEYFYACTGAVLCEQCLIASNNTNNRRPDVV